MYQRWPKGFGELEGEGLLPKGRATQEVAALKRCSAVQGHCH